MTMNKMTRKVVTLFQSENFCFVYFNISINEKERYNSKHYLIKGKIDHAKHLYNVFDTAPLCSAIEKTKNINEIEKKRITIMENSK